MLSPWVHELATFVSLTAASVWLVVHLVRMSKPRGSVGCARCEHNTLTPAPVMPTPSKRGVRSKQLRVIGQR